MMEDIKCSGMMRTGQRCECIAKFTVNGKRFCGRHVKPSQTVQTVQTVASTMERLHSLPLPCDQDISSPLRTEHNLFALTLFKWFIGLLWKIYYRFGLLIILIMVVCFGHACLKAYYYKHCDSNLLKVWLFKQSKLCTTLGDSIKVMEAWSSMNTNQIFEYIVAIFQNSTYFKLVTEILKT
jgi:hypothetical protein